jgi:hypothetical protein
MRTRSFTVASIFSQMIKKSKKDLNMTYSPESIIENFKANDLEGLLLNLKKEFPFSIQVQIEWEGISREMETNQIQIEGLKIYFKSVYIEPTIKAFRSFAEKNKNGFSKLKSEIDKLCFCATDEWKFGTDAYYKKGSTFVVDHIFSNIDSFGEEEREKDLTRFLNNSFKNI